MSSQYIEAYTLKHIEKRTGVVSWLWETLCTWKEKKSKLIAKGRYSLIQPYSTNARQILYNWNIEKLEWFHQQSLIVKINWNNMSLTSLSLSKHKATASKTASWKHHLQNRLCTQYKPWQTSATNQQWTEEKPVADACVVIRINGNRRWKGAISICKTELLTKNRPLWRQITLTAYNTFWKSTPSRLKVSEEDRSLVGSFLKFRMDVPYKDRFC